ncbi:MAG: hypothetical protein AB7T20_12775 [Steroidobacteraceae bacterium]
MRAGRVAVLLAGLTWLPMLVLALIAGRAYGDDMAIPFLSDFVAIGRQLVALPLLVLIHPVIDREIVRTIVNLRESGLVRPADEGVLRQKLERAGQLWRSPFVRLLLVAFIVIAAVTMHRVAVSVDAPDWLVGGEPGQPALSAAGWWNLAVAGPVFRLFVLLALWKLLVWSWILLQLSRMPLNYQTMHADGCAGLGILERVQFGFSGFAAALAIQFGCIIADAAIHKGHDLASFRLPAVAFIVLMLLLLLAPLAVFVRPLSQACIRAELAFHAWFSRASSEVERSLGQTGDQAVASRLGSPELSSLTDASALYAGALRTRKIPITRRSLVVVVLASVVPMAVPLLPLLPLKEIALRLVKVVM